MDTGAEVTAISEQTFNNLRGITLTKPSKILHGPTGRTLKVLGQFNGTLSIDNEQLSEPVYVIRGLRTNLLGLPAIAALNLISRINATSTGTEELDWLAQYPSLFKGLGNLGEPYSIKLREGAEPHALYTPRRVPIPMRARVKEELDRMERAGVISKVTEPTPWCSGMVVVPKQSGTVRICVDLKDLNESVLRETHPIPGVDDTLAQLSGATVFSKVDATSGFWQIPLSEDSRLLTTFITPYGRYCFNKLPFGISSAPELFQSRMNKILEGLEGVVCHMDDVLIYGANKAEHNTRLKAVLERLQAAGITLNARKCEFNKNRIRFLGHILDKDGIHPDPEKISAILQMESPGNVSELRRFMGMANQLGKFSPNLSELSRPLRELLSTRQSWVWGPSQEKSFADIKQELTQPAVLCLYDPDAPVKVSADASSYSLRAVLLQQVGSVWRPVAYASRAMTETERRYAQIEKEALASTWACERFSNYILGRRFLIESDHKPLIPLLNSKQLDDLPPRILRFRLRMARFDYTVHHVPGKFMYTADTLSRAPVSQVDEECLELQTEVEAFLDSVVQSLPATTHQLETYRRAQTEDSVCSKIAEYCQSSWPERRAVDASIIPYWKARSSISLQQGLLLYNQRIIVPSALQEETLHRIHEGHQGIERCRMRTKSSVWWPGIASQITSLIENCPTCAKEAKLRREPLLTTKLPDYPWQVLGSDLFELKGDQYLLVTDYFSRYLEVVKLSSTTSSSIIRALKGIFSRFGIPEVLRSDNGPQYASTEFEGFAKEYGFRHDTSSPYYPQSNGLAERMVQTAKRLLKRSDDSYLALLSYRATPLPWCNLSPAQLLMGRCLRTTVPQTSTHLTPKWSYLEQFRKEENNFKQKQRRYYDNHYRTRELTILPDDTDVWIRSGKEPLRGKVISQANAPRSYIVDTPAGTLRRNRSHIQVVPDSAPGNTGLGESGSTRSESPTRRITTRSQTGTQIRPPDRYSPGREM